jgi:hypothetical protein
MPVPEGVITTSQTTEPEEKRDDLSTVPESSGAESTEEDQASEE